MPAEFNAQLQALFEQQQVLFKQWITSCAPENPSSQNMTDDHVRTATLMATHAAGFIHQNTQTIEQLKSQTFDHLQVDELLESLTESSIKTALNTLFKQWQMPEQLSSLFKTHAIPDQPFAENPFINGAQHWMHFVSPETQAAFQCKVKAGFDALISHQKALGTFAQMYMAITKSAVEQMRITLNQGDSPIETLGELHDLWVECYESVYADTIRTDAYQKSYGDITNSYMTLNAFYQDLQSDIYEQQGLATNKGLDSTLKRQQALRKEMREVKQQLEIQRQINEQLHQAVQALSHQLDSVQSLTSHDKVSVSDTKETHKTTLRNNVN